MKKLIALTLCAVMALSVTACSTDKPGTKDEPEKVADNVQIPNPWVDCETIADAEKLAGFTVILPKTIPEGYTQDSIEAVKDDSVQIIYKNGEEQILFRQGKGSNDISGDYNEYSDTKTLTICNLQVSIKGNNGKISVATWVNGEYTYALSAGFNEAGFDETVLTDMVGSIQ